MPHRVYRVKNVDRPKFDAALGDDILSRQSLRIVDAKHFGISGDWVYLFVDGEEKGMLRADAVVLEFGERAPDGDELRVKLQEEDDAAASGLGSIFG